MIPKLPKDVRAYAAQTLGWSTATIDKVEAEFYLTHEMNWSEASWEEIRDALTEVLNEVMTENPCSVAGRETSRL